MNMAPYFFTHPDRPTAASLMSSNPQPPSSPPKKTSKKNNKAPQAHSGPARPTALRRFFAVRSSPEAWEDAAKFEASLPLILSAALEKENAPVSLALTRKINPNSTVSVELPPTQPAAEYVSFFNLLTDVLNDSLPIKLNHFSCFQLAPSTVDFAIHTVPLHALPLDNAELPITMKQALRYASGNTIEISSARYLRSDPSLRTKATSTIVVAVSLAQADQFPSSINLFSRLRRCERLIATNAATQCRNCQQFGQIAARCKQDHPTYPICSLNHTRVAHRCSNDGCEKGGNLKPVPDCCGATLSKCSICKLSHPSFSPSCPSRITALASLKARFTKAAPAPTPEPTPRTNEPMEEDTAVTDGRI